MSAGVHILNGTTGATTGDTGASTGDTGAVPQDDIQYCTVAPAESVILQ